MTSLGPVRGTLRRLRARGCRLRRLSDMLLCDATEAEEDVMADVEEREKAVWHRLEQLDLADNQITEIDR